MQMPFRKKHKKKYTKMYYVHLLLATGGGTGLLPRAPGTWGSLAALPGAWFIVSAFGHTTLLIATFLVFSVGIWAAQGYVDHLASSNGQDTKDPGVIVIDEIVGQWLVLVFCSLDFFVYGAGFVLFRLADIFKPWPVSVVDRNVKGGLGIMLDDVLAAPYAILALYIIHVLTNKQILRLDWIQI